MLYVIFDKIVYHSTWDEIVSNEADLKYTKTIGRIIITAVILFRQDEIRNIIPPNKNISSANIPRITITS